MRTEKAGPRNAVRFPRQPRGCLGDGQDRFFRNFFGTSAIIRFVSKAISTIAKAGVGKCFLAGPE